MDGHNLTNEQILAFSTALFQAERSQATVEKYLRSVRAFFLYLNGQPVTKDTVLAWKKYLQREENYSPSTVNASLAALNYLFNFLGWADCRTHYLKIQRRLFRETGRELDRADYEKLIAAALGLGQRLMGFPPPVRKISPEVIFCFLAYFSSFLHNFPGSRIVRILPFNEMVALPARTASTVMYRTSPTRMPVAQMVSMTRAIRSRPKPSAAAISFS